MGVPCDGIPHFMRLPSRRKGCCLVFLRSVVGTGLGRIFVNCRMRYDCYYGVSHSTSIFMSSMPTRDVIRGLGRGIGGHGVKTVYHFICSQGVPSSFLSTLMRTLKVGQRRLIPNSGRLGLRSLTSLPGPGPSVPTVIGPRPVFLPKVGRGRFVCHQVTGQSVLLCCPCRDFRRFVRFLCRTIRSPFYHRVVVARCHITRRSRIVGTLVTTTQGKGRIAIFIRLGTHFSRRGGLTATRLVQGTKVSVVFDVPKLGMRTGMTLVLQGGSGKRQLEDCTCIDANGFGRGATGVCTSVTLCAYGGRVISSVYALFGILQGRIARPHFGHLLVTQFGLLPRLGTLVRQRVSLIGRKGPNQVVLGVGTLRSATVVSRLCHTDRTKMRVSLVMEKVYYLIPKRSFDEGVQIAHVISDFLRRTHI